MTESLRRSLADTFSLGDAPTTWEPPAALPERTTLRGAVVELERSLRPATPAHVQWCVGKLMVMPARGGDFTKAAMQTDNFIDACGHFPDDLWSAGTLELLQTKTFRPSPAELFAVISAKYDQRRRMLDRAKWMLNPIGNAEAPEEKPIPTRLGRIEHTRTIYARMNRIRDVERIDREIAAEKGEPVPASSVAEIRDIPERPPFKPIDSPSARRCAKLAAERHTGKPAPSPRVADRDEPPAPIEIA